MTVDSTILNFERMTRYSLSKFLIRVQTFFLEDYPVLVIFFQNGGEIDGDIFTKLDLLKKESLFVKKLFSQNKNILDDYSFWNLLIEIENIDHNLMIADNLNKFLRTSNTRYNAGSKTFVEYSIPKEKTIESVLEKDGGISDFDNAWMNIALENAISEQEYRKKKSFTIKISTPQRLQSPLLSVIGSSEGIKSYGMDLPNKYAIADGDLVSLNYAETLSQTFNNLSDLLIGGIPQFPFLGTDAALIGDNVSFFNLPSLLRQKEQTFLSDDCFVSFNPKGISFSQDRLIYEFQVTTYNSKQIDLQISS